MRLRKGSMTITLLETLWKYSQLPYSFIRLLPGDYEWKKDCLQKLIKAEYVAIIKDTNLKCLYLKPLGQEAYLRFCERTDTLPSSPSRPSVVYYADKAKRAEKVNEAQLLADLAGRIHYQSSQRIKKTMEQDAPRSSDSIKYSRFAGVLFTEQGGLMVYHFGRKNIHLNVNGERSAIHEAGKLYRKLGGQIRSPHFPMLILGCSMDTAREIVTYGDKLAAKSKGQRKHLKTRHFTIKEFGFVFYGILFLPIMESAPDMLRILARSDSSKRLRELPRGRVSQGYQAINLLDCSLASWYDNLDSSRPTVFYCYDWQVASLNTFFPVRANHPQRQLCIYDPAALLNWLEQSAA